jgi:hypothetical protein
MPATARPLPRAASAVLVLLTGLAACQGPRPTDASGAAAHDNAHAAQARPVAADPLAFLTPFLGAPFERTIGSGDAAMAARVETTVLLPGVLVRQQTVALRSGVWTPVVEAYFARDARRERVTFRAFTIDGSTMEGTARGRGDEVVVDFDLSVDGALVELRQVYVFEGPGRCRWTTHTRDEESARLFDSGEMRRPVRVAEEPQSP